MAILGIKMRIYFKRPVAVIDLETTGLDIKTAKIVSIGIVILDCDGMIKYRKEWCVNPCVEIPKHTIDIHGITNEMANNSLPFSVLAGTIAELLSNCDIAGYNIKKFDLPILKREFALAGISNFGKDTNVIDVRTIFIKNLHKDLSSAVQHYLNRPHQDAHQALADASVTAEILLKQIDVHNLSSDACELQVYCQKEEHSCC